jgi:hypothetical protein
VVVVFRVFVRVVARMVVVLVLRVVAVVAVMVLVLRRMSVAGWKGCAIRK